MNEGLNGRLQPPLRTVVTLSSIVLVLVLGDASIDEKVGTPFVGLNIGRPWVIEAFLLGFLAVNLWQFWVRCSDAWGFQKGVQHKAMLLLNMNEGLFLRVCTRCHEELLRKGTTEGESLELRPELRPKSISLLLFNWRVVLKGDNPGTGARVEGEEVTLSFWELFFWKLHSVIWWVWDSDSFPTRQLPFALGFTALLLGIWDLLTELYCAK